MYVLRLRIVCPCHLLTGTQLLAHCLFQMVSIKSRHVDTNNQEPPWLMDARNACPQMYGRLAANAIKSNAVNSSVTKRSKTQGAANQVRAHTGHASCCPEGGERD